MDETATPTVYDLGFNVVGEHYCLHVGFNDIAGLVCFGRLFEPDTIVSVESDTMMIPRAPGTPRSRSAICALLSPGFDTLAKAFSLSCSFTRVTSRLMPTGSSSTCRAPHILSVEDRQLPLHHVGVECWHFHFFWGSAAVCFFGTRLAVSRSNCSRLYTKTTS